MAIQIKKNIDQPKSDTPKAIQNESTNNNQVSDEQLKTFLRQYELKNLSITDMYKIYARNAMTPFFQNTLKSALILIFLPALTNLYYTFRPNTPLAGIMPFAMPFICISQYVYVINKDFEKFCFNNNQDSKQLREKYKILYAYSLHDKSIDDVVEDIIDLEQKQKKNKVV